MDFLMRSSGIAAAFIFLVFVAVLGSLHPYYSHLTQAVSELGARDAPYNDFLNFGCLIPVGILTFVFSISMFRTVRYIFWACAASATAVHLYVDYYYGDRNENDRK